MLLVNILLYCWIWLINQLSPTLLSVAAPKDEMLKVSYETDWSFDEPEIEFTEEEYRYYEGLVVDKRVSSDELKNLIELEKCRKSIFYFADNYVHIKTSRGFKKLELYPWQRKLLFELVEGNNLIVLKSRQIGCSWVGALYALWMCLFHRDKSVYFFSVNKDKARSQLGRVKAYLSKLPDWMKQGVDVLTLEIRFAATESICQSLPAGENTARGETANFVFCDEMGFWDFDTYMWAGIAPTISTGGQCMVVSTPPEPERGLTVFQERYETINLALGRTDNLSSEFAESVARGESDLDDGLDYSKWKSHVIHYSQNPGRDAAWVRTQRADMTDAMWNREYELVMGEVGYPYFTIAKIKHDFKAKPAPGVVKQFATGIDSSELKKGLDLACIVSLSLDGTVCDVYYSNPKYPMSLDDWAGTKVNGSKNFVPTWIRNHPGYTFIEDNAVGMVTYTHAKDLSDGQDQIVRPFRTGEKSRKKALTELGVDLESGEIIITDEYLYKCLCNFVQTEKGKPVAAFGWKDDPVLALALANQARRDMMKLEGRAQGRPTAQDYRVDVHDAVNTGILLVEHPAPEPVSNGYDDSRSVRWSSSNKRRWSEDLGL